MKTPEEWNKQLAWTTDSNCYVIKQIQTEAWNEAIRAAAENARSMADCPNFNCHGESVDKDSILKLLKP